MSLSVAVLFESWTKVERVDLLSAFASMSGLVTRCLKPRVENLDRLGWNYMSRNGWRYRRYRRRLITWDVAVEAMCLSIASGLPQRLANTVNASPCVHILWSMRHPL